MISVDRSGFGDGKYFNFMKSDVDDLLGSYKQGSTHDVEQWRDGVRIKTNATILLWIARYGGSTGDADAQGRYNPISTAASGQWKTGDKFCFDRGK